MSIRNIFKKSVTDLEQKTQVPTPQNDFTPQEKKELFLRTKMYVILQDIIEELKNNFATDEEIVGYIPFTNEDNSAAATAGLLGMMHVNTPQGKDYLNSFHELRGHRLFLFTNKKMYFMVVLEFIEEQRFYTYDYNSIHKIKLKKKSIKYREWQSLTRSVKGESIYYTFDFQAGERIFTEMLTKEEGEKFLGIRENIPALKEIPLSDSVSRNSLFDYLFSNVNFATRAAIIGSWLLFGSLFLYFVYAIIQIYFFPETIKMPNLPEIPELPVPSELPKIPGASQIGKTLIGLAQYLRLF